MGVYTAYSHSSGYPWGSQREFHPYIQFIWNRSPIRHSRAEPHPTLGTGAKAPSTQAAEPGYEGVSIPSSRLRPTPPHYHPLDCLYLRAHRWGLRFTQVCSRLYSSASIFHASRKEPETLCSSYFCWSLQRWYLRGLYNRRVASKLHAYPASRSVLFLDNASSHHKNIDIIKRACRAKGVWLRFLPPYSPDFNPIEESFHDLKACIRRNYRRERRNHTSYQSFLEWAVRERGTGEEAQRRARGHFRNAGINNTP